MIANAIRLENSTNFVCEHKSILKLDRLSFSINNIISSYNNLKVLVLSNNNLTNLYTKQFLNLTELTYINLKYNLLSVIGSKIFNHNTKLIRIDVSHNKIKNFKFELSKLPSLTALHIQYNKLTSLKESAFKAYISGNMSINNTLRVNDNTLMCKCPMFWILKLEDSLKADIYNDNLCVGDLLINVSLSCFFNNNNTETLTQCEPIQNINCDNG